MTLRYNAILTPPTPKELRSFIALLERGAFPENAAARIGWDATMLRQAIRKGRAGVPGFKKFVESMDDVLFRQSDQIWEKILEEAQKGNFSALKYLHQTRVLPRQKALQEAVLKDEFSSGAEDEAAFTEDDLRAAEARALGAGEADDAAPDPTSEIH